MKKCLRCLVEKDESVFVKDKRKKSGITAECKECYNTIRKEYIGKNRERTRQNYNNYYYRHNERIRKHNREKTVEYREKNRERIRNYAMKYYINNAEKLRLKASEYAKNQKAVERRRKRVREYSRSEGEKHKVRSRKLFYYAVKIGHITRGTKCESCGTEEGKMQGHHDDYTKPLEVKWLCHKCHCHQHDKLLDLKDVSESG